MMKNAPIPYRNNVIKSYQSKKSLYLIAPIPYRNNVIKKGRDVSVCTIRAPIPYRNNVIIKRVLKSTYPKNKLQFHIGIM